jgi:hypothetical protein
VAVTVDELVEIGGVVVSVSDVVFVVVFMLVLSAELVVG